LLPLAGNPWLAGQPALRLEEKNRELTELLERAYGAIAQT
jgi:hypothetical protein